MEQMAITGVVLGTLAIKALGIFALAYAGARLAIRHERRASRS